MSNKRGLDELPIYVSTMDWLLAVSCWLLAIGSWLEPLRPYRIQSRLVSSHSVSVTPPRRPVGTHDLCVRPRPLCQSVTASVVLLLAGVIRAIRAIGTLNSNF